MYYLRSMVQLKGASMKAFIIVLAVSLPLLAAAHSELEWSAMEESGESGETSDVHLEGILTPRVQSAVLLIPDSNADAVGMYDPYDGSYLGDFIINDPTGTLYSFTTPINAVQGPADNIYVSDQISDAVYAFDSEGSFLFVAADATHLDNSRGIDFRNDTLFVTSGDGYVQMFSGPCSFAGYFINDGSDPFDILFLPDGTSLMSDIEGSSDNIRLYDINGANPDILFTIDFPEQVQFDEGTVDHYLCAGFSADILTEFLLDGTIIDTWPLSGARGVYRLGNGNLLATNGDGVHEIDPATGAVIELEYSGSCRFIELADITVTGIEQEEPGSRIDQISLVPNPFASQLSISFNVREASDVTIDVFSISGRIVKTIDPGVMTSGIHTVVWDGTEEGEGSLDQGIYFVRVSTSAGYAVEKVNLIR